MTTTNNPTKNNLSDQEASAIRADLEKLSQALSGVIFGQEELVEHLLVGIIARGHILLEGLPGLGKTELVKTLARAVDMKVRRIQFTPDLLPGDITGNPILQEENGKRHFVFQAGPVFTNLLLADEINRASPKTQSALLEAMQEGAVTVFGETYSLPQPFFVLATQNPIELEGTYPLPEAQLDRFLFKLKVTHRSAEILERIVRERELGVDAEVPTVLGVDRLKHIIQETRRVFLPVTVANYIARIVHATHDTKRTTIKHGASPRAALALASAGRARAVLNGRANVSFEDIQDLAPLVLGHRLILDYSARIAGKTAEDLVHSILEEIRPLDRNTPQLLDEHA